MREIAILIPAHNEEVVLGHTLKSLVKFIPKIDIYVVNDGSIDKTENIAKKFTSHVYSRTNNSGKARALNAAIDHFNFYKKYKYLMPLDADSVISKTFLKRILRVFEKDIEKEIICVIGRVQSKKTNRFTAYRMWEYEIAQTVHKRAQEKINAITVCPGCSTIFRTDLFKKTKIPSGTLTEDMDLTFEIYRKNLGKIVYANNASVVTQDPNDLKNLTKQLDRWYTGFWQCVLKHNIPWGGQMLDLEVGLLATEGLFGGFLVVTMFFAVPFALNIKPSILIAPIAFDFLLFVFPTIVYAAIKNKTPFIIRHIFFFYLLRLLGSLIFLKSFFKVVFSLDIKMKFWDRVKRYNFSS